MASKLSILMRIEDDGSLWATVEEMPGVYATGDTENELRESLEEGISLWLAKPGEPAPNVSLSELHRREAVASADLVYA
jgi:predicted RNase H-like HicB family nuclease